MRILVTGSSGTVGTHLCEKLTELGHLVTGLDVRENHWTNAKTTIIDLCNERDLMKLKGDFDLIVHLAANARVFNLVLDPKKALDNILMTFNIIEYARFNKIKKIIFSSSREIYGNRNVIEASEEDVTIDSESPYSASKLSCEALIRSYQKCYGIDYIIFRLSNVYGMYDESDRAIPLFIKRARKNGDIEIFGRDKVLDFTYISDCISGIIFGIEKFEKIKNNTFNLASGSGDNISDVAKIICKLLNSKSKIVYRDSRIGEVTKYKADISKIAGFGWRPQITLKDGLKKSVDWYTKNMPNL